MKKTILIGGLFLILILIVGCGVITTEEKLKERDRLAQTEKETDVQTTFSKLEITNIVYEDGKVKIDGITDLPDGSQINVDFNIAGRSPEDTYIGVSKKVESKGGKFTAMLIPPNREEFSKGKYVVEAMFTPRRQPSSVLKLIGEDGENLVGGLVRTSFGFNIIEISEDVNLQLIVSSYSMEKPESYPVDSAERALAEWITAWKEKDWDKMVEVSQKTWKDVESNPKEDLEASYGFKDLLGAEITNVKSISDTTTDITATIYYAVGANIKEKTITARVIKETAPYTPSSEGEWGVNPISTLKEI